MAKKKNQHQNNNQNDVVLDDDAKKQLKVVLKMDLHCEGCAGRVVKAVRNLEGVESVRIGDSCELNKLTVIGNLDPVKLRQKVEERTKKKVELISPPPSKKQNDGDDNTKKKQQQQPPTEKTKTAVKKDDDKKKPKELPVTTAVFKVALHCQGCVRRIHKLVTKTKGCVDISFDKDKELVTVKGAIDMKLLGEALKTKLKRQVEIVPAKKDGGDGEKKGKGGDGGGQKGKSGNDGEGKGGGEKKGKMHGAEDGDQGMVVVAMRVCIRLRVMVRWCIRIHNMRMGRVIMWMCLLLRCLVMRTRMLVLLCERRLMVVMCKCEVK